MTPSLSKGYSRCTRCEAIFFDDGNTFCPVCDVLATAKMRGVLPDAADRVREMRAKTQMEAAVALGLDGGAAINPAEAMKLARHDEAPTADEYLTARPVPSGVTGRTAGEARPTFGGVDVSDFCEVDRPLVERAMAPASAGVFSLCSVCAEKIKASADVPVSSGPAYDSEQRAISTNHVAIFPDGRIEVAFTPPESPHSPGPWHWDSDGDLKDADGECVVGADGEALFWGLGGHRTDHADARLIAAAPQLAEALKDTLDAMTLWASEWGPGMKEKFDGYRALLAQIDEKSRG